MGIANKILPHYTYHDYLNWEGKWELHEGHPIAMSPLPIPLHQQTGGNLFYEFKKALKGVCHDCKAYPPIDYKISEDTLLQPDLLVVCGKIENKFLDFPPVVVAEILSPSTVIRDRNTKFLLYQQQGVKYYLIVDIEKKSIEVYQLINGKYELQGSNDKFPFHLSNECVITPEWNNIWE